MSKREIYVCDRCGKEIPVVKRKDCFGIERKYLQSGNLKSINSNPSMFGIDFCKDCAHESCSKAPWGLSV